MTAPATAEILALEPEAITDAYDVRHILRWLARHGHDQAATDLADWIHDLLYGEQPPDIDPSRLHRLRRLAAARIEQLDSLERLGILARLPPTGDHRPPRAWIRTELGDELAEPLATIA